MLLVIDIGNTNIVVGLCKEDMLNDHIRLSSKGDITYDEAGFFITNWLQHMNITNEEIDEVIIASVVPSLTNIMETTSRKFFGCMPTVVSAGMTLPIKIEIDNPDEIGADRICNAVAGYKKYGSPSVIIDFGTATTFDVIGKDGSYIGGIIIPGPETSMAELAKKAARLFEVRIEPPEKIVGKSTVQALQSGLFYGTVGQVDYIIEKIIDETGFTSPIIIATGGLAKGIGKYSKHIKRVDATLTLDGLRLIAGQ